MLVTGGAGFIGSHVVEALVGAGHRVEVLDDLSTGDLRHLPAGVPLHRADVASPEAAALVEALRPDAVLHLAAQVSAAASVRDPVADLRANALGTLNVLEACRRAGVRRFVYASSAAVYGQPERLPLSEDAPLRPLRPYGASKLAGEVYVRLYGDLYGLDFVILRFANVYGPRQAVTGEGAVVPAFATAMLAGTGGRGPGPVVHGDGRQTRDFVHVRDVARAHLLALWAGSGAILNLATGRAVTVLDLWRRIAALTGWDRPPVFGPPRPGDIPHSVLDPSRARQALGWEPATGLDEGLRETVAYYREVAGEPS
ncbi:UDP-glucose 4-epimerase [Caldinitratiruptor microaerophilus]|uniref:UDP-glucose 4-epimerase n=1 Tax=Caldinitratiruptor microaerophilus TaxID=671077 RepID=A0AA35CRG1_9FIRM|nr:UDP-glucose 4-epimerase [Caldinitratiruptor microaerophilus]